MMKKKLLTGALVLGSMWMLAGCGSSEIELTQFVDVKFEGTDGKGYVASYEIDEDELDDALKDANDDLSKSERRKLIDSIEMELKKNTSNLSNGDKVTVQIDWSERKAERYDIVFKGDEKEVKVSGLKEMEKLDAFKDIEIKYSGVSPYVKVTVESTSKNDFLKDCYYSVEYPDDGYCAKAGDEVEISVSYSEYDAEQEGYTIEETTKKVKIKDSDVDAYITKPEEITEDASKEMTEACQSLINEEQFDNEYSYRDMMSELTGAEYNWDFDINTVTKGEYKFDKATLLLAKEEDHGDYQYNKAYFVLENTVQDSVNVNPVTVYYVVSFQDVIKCADGTIDVSLEDARMAGYAANMDAVAQFIEKEAGRTYDIVESEQ